MQSPSAVLPLPPQLAIISTISHMYSSVWQASSPEACITVDAFSFIFQITFRLMCDRIRCCGCFLLRKSITCSEEQKYPWETMKLLSLISISQPWPHSKWCSHLLQSTYQLRGKKHVLLGKTSSGHEMGALFPQHFQAPTRNEAFVFVPMGRSYWHYMLYCGSRN